MQVDASAAPTIVRFHEEYHPDLVADPDFLRRFIASQKWREAKTMPHCPHSYVVRGKGPTEEDFARFVRHIRSFGYDDRWHSLTNRYLDFDGQKYWTMGFEYPVTIIINRCGLSGAPHPFSPNPQKFLAKPGSPGIRRYQEAGARRRVASRGPEDIEVSTDEHRHFAVSTINPTQE